MSGYMELSAIHALVDKVAGDNFYGTLTVKFEGGKPKLAYEERVYNTESIADVMNSPSVGEHSALPKSIRPIKRHLAIKKTGG